MPTLIKPAKPTQQFALRPWLGQAYRERQTAIDQGTTSCCAGHWHVMGESHYGDPAEEMPEFTERVVEELALKGYRFFDTLLAIASGQEVRTGDQLSAWQDFAYSNFVQDILPDDKRRPDSVNWERGRQCFFSQLAFTRPKQLLVVGAEQWSNLPSEGFTPFEPLSGEESGTRDELGLYAYDVDGLTHFTVATWIYHPSSRGKLDVAEAQQRIRNITMASCNLLSDLSREGEDWYYNPAER